MGGAAVAAGGAAIYPPAEAAAAAAAAAVSAASSLWRLAAGPVAFIPPSRADPRDGSSRSIPALSSQMRTDLSFVIPPEASSLSAISLPLATVNTASVRKRSAAAKKTKKQNEPRR